jgi:hypothetical protein
MRCGMPALIRVGRAAIAAVFVMALYTYIAVAIVFVVYLFCEVFR